MRVPFPNALLKKSNIRYVHNVSFIHKQTTTCVKSSATLAF